MKNKNLAKKIIAFTCLFFMLFSFVGQYEIYAKTDQEKLEDIQSSIKDKQADLDNKNKSASQLRSEISNLDKQITKLDDTISGYQKDIEEAQGKIDAIQLELDEAIAERERCQNLLGERLEIMYMYGDVGYLELLFSSKNFSDLISRLSAIKTLVTYDKEILSQLEQAENLIIKKKAEIEEEKLQLDNAIAKLEEEQASLDVLKEERNAKLSALNTDINALSQLIDEEQKEADELLKKIVESGGGSYINSGKLAWPVPSSTRVTSPYGYRYHPISGAYRFHTGTDIAAGYGVNIVAPGTGKVTMASYYGGYGYTVIIDLGRDSDGNRLSTLLAHNSKLLVSAGETVVRGQTVAKAGSTGNSTGPHCHIEIVVNGSRQNPINWIK